MSIIQAGMCILIVGWQWWLSY